MHSNQNEIITVIHTEKIGKIVKINLAYNKKSQLIHSIKITGDFFLHPEEMIEKLEQELHGIKLNREELQNEIQKILENTEFFGFNIETLVDAIMKTKGD